VPDNAHVSSVIERQTIRGRPATVSYLTDDFEPTDMASATLVKIVYDDGQSVLLRNEPRLPANEAI
jgi:hypothetical protein